jgi:protocatechuate 3,4-dioxygenase beta subunit
VQVELSEGVRVAGRVITDGGEPVEGAKLVASGSGDFFPRTGRGFSHAVSDAQGNFVIPALKPGNYRLTATHKEHPPASSPPLSIDRKKDDIEIVMSAGARIEGRVVGADNTRVPWAEVRLQESGRGFRFRQMRAATADREGLFSFSGLPRKQVQLMAMGEKASSPMQPVDLTDTPVVTGVELRLTQDGRIAGRVVDSRGAAAPEVYVTAWGDFMSDDSPADMRMRRWLQTVTDGGGRFAFEGLSPGAYRLMASRVHLRGRGRGRFFSRRGTAARTGDEDVTLTLEEAGGIRGRVVLASGEAPERFGVSVDWNPAVPFEDTGGEFEIKPVEPGEHLVVISGDSFADHDLPGNVQVKGQETTDLGEIVIQPGRTVTGRVTDSQQRPVEGAKVMVDYFLFGSGTTLGNRFPRGGFEGPRSAQTTGDGTFRLESVSTDRQVIAAEHDQLGRSKVVSIPASKGETHIELVLIGTGSVEGLVTAGQTPVAEAQIHARPVDGEAVVVVTAGADGRFLIEKLPEGQHNIEAARGGFGSGRESLRKNVVVRAGETTQVQFHFDPGIATLVVDVTIPDQVQLDLALVVLFSGNTSFSSAAELFAARGTSEGKVYTTRWRPGKPARFTRLAPGDYTACVIAIKFDSKRMQGGFGDDQVHCLPCPVADSADEQRFVIEMPLMETPAEAPPEDNLSVPDAGQERPRKQNR